MHSLGVELIDSLASGRYGQFVHIFMPDQTLRTSFTYCTVPVPGGTVQSLPSGPTTLPRSRVLACLLLYCTVHPILHNNATSSQHRVTDQHVLTTCLTSTRTRDPDGVSVCTFVHMLVKVLRLCDPQFDAALAREHQDLLSF